MGQVISAFTKEQTSKLSGVTESQLISWDRSGFFEPTFAYEDRKAPLSRIYSFRDLLCLKVIARLRNQEGVSLQHLKKVKSKLAHLGDDLWDRTTLYVLNKRVIFKNPESEDLEEIVTGQGILSIPLQVVSGDMESAVHKMFSRDPDNFGVIEQKRGVAHGKHRIAGTRVKVETIKRFHEAGYSVSEIIDEYPSLTEKDVRAAIQFESVA